MSSQVLYFRPTAMSVAIASLGLLSGFTPSAHAVDDQEVAELKAALARSNAEIARLKAALQSSGIAVDAAPAQPPERQVAPMAEPVLEEGRASRSENGTLDTVVIRSARKNLLTVIKDTPISISAVSGQELDKMQATQMGDILKRIGNVRLAGSSNNPTTGQFALRGLGYGAGGTEAGVNITVDGIPFLNPGMASFNSYYDLDSVQVLRGPQGTRGGNSGNLGLVEFASRAPSFTPEAGISATYGLLNTLYTRAYATGPVIDGLLAARVTISREQADGPWENTYNTTQLVDNNITYQNVDRSYGKLQLLFTPTSSFSALLGIDITPKSRENYTSGQDSGYAERFTPEFYDTRNANGDRIRVDQSATIQGKLSRRWFTQDTSVNVNDIYGPNGGGGTPTAADIFSLSETRGTSLRLDWQVNERSRLQSITGWRQSVWEYNDPNNSQRVPFTVREGTGNNGGGGTRRFSQVTQEIRLDSELNKDFKYRVGTYLARTSNQSGGSGSRGYFGADAGAFLASDAQYNILDTDSAGRYLLLNSLNRYRNSRYFETDGKSIALFGNVDWAATPRLTLNSGLRAQWEKRTGGGFNVIDNNGNAPELNPVSVNNLATGGFNSYGLTGVPTGSLPGQLRTNTQAQLALADYTANKYFGVNYNALTDAQRRQIAAAKDVRASQLAGLYLPKQAESFSDTLYTANFSPSYKLNDDHTLHFSTQYGEKAGVVQLVGTTTANGAVSATTKPESSVSYELGLKSYFLNKKLFVATTVFQQNVRNYISPTYYYDEEQTLASATPNINVYTAGTGNVPRVRSRGVELDVAYTLPRTTLRLAATYTDARFVDQKRMGKPPELGGSTQPYFDASGQRMPGTAPFNLNLFAEQVIPAWDNHELYVNGNYNHQSSYLTQQNLSRYSEWGGFGVTDASVGLRNGNKTFSVELLVKNLFNTDTSYTPTWNHYYGSVPRWVGLTTSLKFF